MGYGIVPYAVDTKVLRQPHAFTVDPTGFFEWMSEVHLQDGGSEVDAQRDALRELFFCQSHTGHGSGYGYALEILCQRFGGRLNNEFWYPFGDSWLETVGAGLRSLGALFDPNVLLDTGAPVALPRIDDFPVIGHVLRPALIRLTNELAGVNLSAVDKGVAGAIRNLGEWARFCAAADEEDFDLVCFYY
ncbi:DUF7691 family protein [Nocardia iowensis]|uniref:DUF7691 domain-containing protein n=1 Tax=Nocardia iowensis TaxID=204891 RepID=A0ABX8RZP0_NOCIO|nr:hypothetical protein [Nocardia iowensis]QXN94452.1 hypothetical protein KV110_16170 [Nocardia iowensis]